jgi:hypothetical protein
MKVIARSSSLLGRITILVMVVLCVNTAVALDGSGMQEDPWRIQSLEDFNDFAADANYWAGFTRLETDVDLAGRVYDRAVIAWDVSDVFTGVFDGNDRKIIGLTIDGGVKDYLGLFGQIGYESEVRNLSLQGGSVSGGDYYTGSLVGRNGKWDMPGGTISNCYSNVDVSGFDDVGGLCGSNYGTISNCRSEGSVNGGNGSYDIGGLCGRNYDTISNCDASGSVSGGIRVGGLVGDSWGEIYKCYATGSVSGHEDVGGLAGGNMGSIASCYSTSSVRGTNLHVGGLVGINLITIGFSYSTGEVYGVEEVGGLAGDNWGEIYNCYSTGNVSATGDRVGGLCGESYLNDPGCYIYKCYATGSVNGGLNVGGLVGYNNSAIVYSFWDTETSGTTDGVGNMDPDPIGVTAKTTAEMQTLSTFMDAYWRFDSVWDLTCEGMNYPRFIWQIPSADFVCPHGVDCRDYSFFANRWMNINCGAANDCGGADLDFSDKVDGADMKIFCAQWLEGKIN